jgi:hypothetical protein
MVSRFGSPAAMALAASTALLALVGGVGACGSGAQCALDSDCPLGQRCNTANQCVPRGGGEIDAAVERDSGPRADTGPAPMDTGPVADAGADAPVADDAAMLDDANDDADLDAFDSCPVIGPTYMVSRVGIGCMSSASVVSFVRRPGECAYDVSSDRRGDLEGTFTFDMGGFRGGINFPDVGRTCTLDVFAAAAAMSCSGGCNIELTETAP